MTIESWNSYPKVYALGHRSIQEILIGDVLVQEKIDGSQISFGRFDGVLRIRSRNKEMIVEAPEKMFKKAVETIEELDLIDGWTYRGEYLAKPKHNTLAYDRVPDGHIILFDIATDGAECYTTPEYVMKEANRLGLEVVPTFYTGRVQEKAELVDFLDRESCLGGPKIEGFVIKNYNRFNMQDGKPLFGKYVSEAFKEKHSKEWTNHSARKEVIAQIIEEYSVEARYQKAFQHLVEGEGTYGDPRDIGPLIKEVQADVDEECADEIGLRLYNHFKKEIMRGISKGVPNWYKGELLNKQFEEVSHE